MSTHPRKDSQSKEPRRPPPADNDLPLEVEPDDEDERQGYGWQWSQRVAERLHAESARTSANGNNDETILDLNDVSVVDRAAIGAEAGHMSDVLRWALDSMHEPAMAAADWLARDIDAEQPTAAALLSNPRITLMQVKQAKSVFKTMRIVGEKTADRRVGARMYAAAIAAGLVRHRTLISRQSTNALKRGFQGLLDDQRMPQPLRDLAGMAICALNDKQYTIDAKDAKRPSAKSPAPRPQHNSANGQNHGKPRQRKR